MKIKTESTEEFIKHNFVVCKCGYNNKIEYVNYYGSCLRCGKILNEKAYFKKKLKLEIKKENKKLGIL